MTVTTATDVAIRTSGLSAGYAGVPAIREVDLSVAGGEVVTLLGANGAGKTTTLLTIAGELTPMQGSIELLGEDRRRAMDQRARGGLGFLPEGRSVFMGLSGRDNLRLGRGSIDDALSYFPELEPHLGKRAGLLSGGQQQMLALARVLAAKPRVILADELSLGLAPLIVTRLLGALRAAADQGVAVLLVEQHVAQALAVADRAYVLRRGRIVLDGQASELRSDAADIARHYLESS